MADQVPQGEGQFADDGGVGEPAYYDVAPVFEHPMAEQMAYLQQRLDSHEMVMSAQQLVNEIPEMGDPEHGPQVVQAAQQLAAQLGRPELGQAPAFWRLVHLAGNGMPAQQPAVDPAEQIVPTSGVRGGRHALPF